MMRPAKPLMGSNVFRKWYLVYPHERPFAGTDVKEAGRLELRDEIGFTVQHRCASVNILYVCSWRENNELWETLYSSPADETFQLVSWLSKTGTYCVWVIVAHLSELSPR
jgi:hypothetical protein